VGRIAVSENQSIELVQEFFAQAARGFCALIQHSCLSYLYSWVHLSIWERFACSPKGFSFQLVCKLTQILRIQKKAPLAI
jgi:hypothetical protein